MDASTISVYGGKGPMILGLTWPAAGVASLLILARFYQWFAIARQGGWALFWSSVSFSLCLLVQVTATVAVRQGIGVHESIILQAGNLQSLLLWAWITICVFQPAIGSGKVAAASFLLAVQGPTFKKGRYFLHFVALSNMLMTIPLAFFTFLQCSPVEKLWQPFVPGLCHTWAYHTFIYADGGYTSLTDVALSIYPVFLLWSIQMDTRLKWVYRFLLGLIGFTCVCSCFRTYSIYVINSTPLDTSYALTDLFIWGGIEMWVTLITTSIPALWPFVRRCCPQKVKKMGRISVQQLSPRRAAGRSSSSSPTEAAHRNPLPVPSKSKPRHGLNKVTISSLLNAEDAWKLTPRGMRSPATPVQERPMVPPKPQPHRSPSPDKEGAALPVNKILPNVDPRPQAHTAHISHTVAPGHERDAEALAPDLIAIRQDVSVKHESVESWDFADYDGVTVPSHAATEVSWKSIVSKTNPYHDQVPSSSRREQQDVGRGIATKDESSESCYSLDDRKGDPTHGEDVPVKGSADSRPQPSRTRTEVTEANFGDLGLLPMRVVL